MFKYGQPALYSGPCFLSSCASIGTQTTCHYSINLCVANSRTSTSLVDFSQVACGYEYVDSLVSGKCYYSSYLSGNITQSAYGIAIQEGGRNYVVPVTRATYIVAGTTITTNAVYIPTSAALTYAPLVTATGQTNLDINVTASRTRSSSARSSTISSSSRSSSSSLVTPFTTTSINLVVTMTASPTATTRSSAGMNTMSKLALMAMVMVNIL